MIWQTQKTIARDDFETTMAILIEGSLEVKLPTTWTVGKAEVGRVSEDKKRSEKIREEKE